MYKKYQGDFKIENETATYIRSQNTERIRSQLTESTLESTAYHKIHCGSNLSVNCTHNSAILKLGLFAVKLWFLCGKLGINEN